MDFHDEPMSRYPAVCLDHMRELAETYDGKVPTFGLITGFMINYEPKRAARFDLEGELVEILPKAFILGRAGVALKRGRSLTSR